MLCCVGLFGGLAVGQSLGGAWTVIAPAAGFGIGLMADMKLMKGMHKSRDERHTGTAPKEDAVPVRRIDTDEPAAKQEVQHMSTP